MCEKIMSPFLFERWALNAQNICDQQSDGTSVILKISDSESPFLVSAIKESMFFIMSFPYSFS